MKELTVEQWDQERDRGLEFRRKFGLEDSWSMLEALCQNVHESQATSSANILSSTREQLLAALTTPNPYVGATARRPEALAAAPVIEAIDNMLIDDIGLRSEAEIAFDCAYMFGVGFIKNGYDSEFGFDPALDVGRGFGQETGMTLSQYELRTGQRIEFLSCRPGMPWVSAVLPHDIVVPYGTRKLPHAEWIMHRVIRHIDDARADKKYSTKGLEPNVSTESFMSAYTSTMKPYRLGRQIQVGKSNKKPEYVELWEIHDRRSGKILVTATGHGKFLRNETDAMQVDGELPFTAVKFVPSTRSLWTTPDAYYILAHQLELADVTLQRTKRRRLDVLKGLVDKTKFTEEELQRLMSARIGGLVGVNGDPNQAVAWVQPPGNYNLMQEEQSIKENAGETVGMSENQRGETAGARTTAFEVAQVAQATNRKFSRRQTIVKELYQDVVKKINSSIFKYWRTPQIAQVVDQIGQATWVEFTGPALRGQYTLKLTFEDIGSQGRSFERQMAMNLFQVLAADPTVDQINLRRWFARAMNDTGVSSVFKNGILSGELNANVLVQMQQMLQGGGAGPQNGRGAGAGQVPQMQPQVG